MGKQIFNIKGMMRDLDPAKTPNQYAYEIRNLRLTAQEDTTMLALVSEKGNAQYQIIDYGGDPATIQGVIIGYCVLHNYLTIFTHDENDPKAPDRIYRLEMDSMTMTSLLLYAGDLGFGEDGVNIEAIGIYENQDLQKVYWIDSVHQPRFINIVADTAIMSNWSDTSFDFTPIINMNETVEVKKAQYNGMFNAGTIQYILTYYNRNGQQTAAFYQSPINYIAPDSRGAAPDETVNNSFAVRVWNPDTIYDYVRVYSVFRSSENGTPVCKKVMDMKTSNVSSELVNYNEYTMSGGTMTSVPYQLVPLGTANSLHILNSSNVEVDIEDFLLFREGETSYYSLDWHYCALIIPFSDPSTATKIQAATNERMSIWVYNNSTAGINREGTTLLNKWEGVSIQQIVNQRSVPYLECIDNGLFGEVVDYSEILYAGGTNIIPSTMAQKSQTLFFGNYKTVGIEKGEEQIIKDHSTIHFGYSNYEVPKGQIGSYYMYDNQLDKSAKEITEFKGGETYHFGIMLQRSDGSWTSVIPIGSAKNTYYPRDKADNAETFNPVKAYITFDDTAMAVVNAYVAVKVVRLNSVPSVVNQGVVCPTVFNKDREDNLPYCQSSWFFRDVCYDGSAPHKTQNRHNANIRDIVNGSCAEIQGSSQSEIDYYNNSVSLEDVDMFVDWNTLTLHSPDIEWGEVPDFNYRMRIVGVLPITSGITSMSMTYGPPKALLSDNFLYQPIVHNNLDAASYEIELADFMYKDEVPGGNQYYGAGTYLFKVYPWHANRSLTYNMSGGEDDNEYAILETKVMASLRESAYSKYIEVRDYNITGLSIYQEDDNLLYLDEDPDNFLYNGKKVYAGSIDTILTVGSRAYRIYGKSTVDGNVYEFPASGVAANVTDAIRMKYRSSKHGVFSLKSEPHKMYVLPNVSDLYNALITEGTLETKIPKAFVRYSLNTNISPITPSSGNTYTISNFPYLGSAAYGDLIHNPANNAFYYVVSKTSSTLTVRDIDKEWYDSHPGGTEEVTTGTTQVVTKFYICDSVQAYEPPMTEYWSIEWTRTLNPLSDTFSTPTLEGRLPDLSEDHTYTSSYDFNLDKYSYMYLVELYSDATIIQQYDNMSWFVASEANKTGKYCIEASIGDTYYQRYDCLKTYPYSLEDQNQIVEIFSFMCETKVNIDGRYDNRRGMANNTTVIHENFNLMNKAYTQHDNFFTYQYLDLEDFDINEFPNQIIWTKTKVYGSDIDAWTQIIPTSTLDMDGSLGEIRALRLWNDNLMCFQDSGIAKIMYNERTTMSTTQGVPVEIANSGKVDGSQYISNNIGCKNKNSIQVAQDGIYFVDSNTREIYRWSKGLDPLSKSKGFNVYFNDGRLNIDSIKTFYDPGLRDVYFRITKDKGQYTSTECLVYNEQLGEFTSFFDYDMDFMFQYKNALVSVEHNSSNLWKQFAGDEYLRYFDETYDDEPVYKEYSVELISAENPTATKIFTGMEFRADVLGSSITQSGSQLTESGSLLNLASINKLPFKTMRVWNEYQDTGNAVFQRLVRKGANLSQKFRIWRADIDRDHNEKLHHFNRITSPWARFRLRGGGEDIKTVIHDIGVMYV